MQLTHSPCRSWSNCNCKIVTCVSFTHFKLHNFNGITLVFKWTWTEGNIFLWPTHLAEWQEPEIWSASWWMKFFSRNFSLPYFHFSFSLSPFQFVSEKWFQRRFTTGRLLPVRQKERWEERWSGESYSLRVELFSLRGKRKKRRRENIQVRNVIAKREEGRRDESPAGKVTGG